MRLLSAIFAASVTLAAPLVALPAAAAPVALGASQATDAPLIEKAHSNRWRAIARRGARGQGRGGYEGRGGYGRGYGPGYGRPHDGRRYGRPYGYDGR